MRIIAAWTAALTLSAATAFAGDYLVLLDGGDASPFANAARRLADRRKGQVRSWAAADRPATLKLLRELQPATVVFVLAPEKIDVDLAHELLALATRVDDDPFVDFEYGFITGRDGPAAERFVERTLAAADRKFGRRGAFFGTWEGPVLPPAAPLGAMSALGLEFEQHFILARDDEARRAAAARAALGKLSGCDVLLFLSHGYPDQFVGGFRAADLREWRIDLAPAVLINCACYNGAPGRWYELSPTGGVDRGVVKPAESVALALLDSGICAYFAGIDPWHGPLANQLFSYVVDDGLRLGAAAKCMQDRLALEFLPDRINYPPAREHRFAGEGVENRRSNGAGMIFYGDPSLAPFAADPPRLLSVAAEPDADGKLRVKFSLKQLVRGVPATDFMVTQARLLDYYSARGGDLMKSLRCELYRVIPVGSGVTSAPQLRVQTAECGGQALPAGEVQTVLEDTPRGRRLHIRVPLNVQVYGSPWVMMLANQGATVELSE
jgi:hypothetical protein